VVLLRAEGVPARVASGFAPGEFDENTGISIVRENHAHSWVEAYFPRYGWITFEPSSIRPVPQRLEQSPAPPPTPAPAPAELTDTSGMTPEELNELLNIRDSTAPPAQRPFLTTWPGLLVVPIGLVLVLGLLVSAVLAVIWSRGLRGLRGYQRPYAELVRLGSWSRMLRSRVSDTPFDVAERLGRQVPRAQPAIDELTDAYVEGTYSTHPPGQDPWPTWLAVRRAVIRGLFGRRLGGWFGEDTSVALPPKGHPELLSQWGARRKQR
jgi:Transglutaminase-like superfamily/Domain of unknown function (DUF4129)